MYEAEIEAYMIDDEVAQILSEDSGWLEAQWPECIRQAENDGETVTGDPVLASYARLTETDDGYIYLYKFNVPVS